VAPSPPDRQLLRYNYALNLLIKISIHSSDIEGQTCGSFINYRISLNVSLAVFEGRKNQRVVGARGVRGWRGSAGYTAYNSRALVVEDFSHSLYYSRSHNMIIS